MAKYKLIIFDFDGTLADSTAGICATYRHTLNVLGIEGISDDTIISTIGLPLVDAFRVTVPEENLQEAVDIYHEAFPEIAFRTIHTFEGVKKMLKTLYDSGVKMAIATSRGNDSLFALTKSTGIDEFFALKCGWECAPRPKPAPDPVLHILNELSFTAEETIVIGDAVYDIQMGNSAGCQTCAVTWGAQSREKLLTSGPTFIVDKVEDIISIVI